MLYVEVRRGIDVLHIINCVVGTARTILCHICYTFQLASCCN